MMAMAMLTWMSRNSRDYYEALEYSESVTRVRSMPKLARPLSTVVSHASAGTVRQCQPPR